uniref:Uncharacterized protein n=1 Tax=Angiostrongylus cantonensis TaxID=6313 RepID=A0A158P9W4_ANGCA
MVQTRSSRDLDTQLTNETVEETAAGTSIEPHEDQANASTDRGSEEEREDRGLEKHPVPPLDVKIVDLLLNVFAPKTMGKCLIFALGFMLANYLWGFLVWIVNIRNPFRYIGSNKVLNKCKRDCHLLVAGYFPFKNTNTPSGYRAFAASAMMLHSGSLEDEFTCLGVITSQHLAREVGMRFDGDIVTYSFETDRNTEIMTAQLAQLLNESAILLLVTPLAVVYRGQSDVLLFTDVWHPFPARLPSTCETSVVILERFANKLFAILN